MPDMNRNNEGKELTIGADYSVAFGRPAGSLIFMGGISWKMTEGSRSMTADNAKGTEDVLAYVRRPSVMMGSQK